MAKRIMLMACLLFGIIACSAHDDSYRSDTDDGSDQEGSGSDDENEGDTADGEDDTSGGDGDGDGDGDADGDTDTEDCDNLLEVVYRDFNESHPDFERPDPGWGPAKGMLEPSLTGNRKPVLASTTGECQVISTGNGGVDCHDWTGSPMIESKETFAQWYETIDGINVEFNRILELQESPSDPGTFFFDSGTAGFFPIGVNEGYGASPSGSGKNYLFTTEIHLMFEYVSGQVFTFRGDDDLWIFVNGKIALDLGGLHSPFEASIDFDAVAGQLGIAPGGTYEMDIFHAERHTVDSNFRIETNIRCFMPGIVV